MLRLIRRNMHHNHRLDLIAAVPHIATDVLPSMPDIALPDTIHTQAPGNGPSSQRTIIIGDVHGCFDELMSLLVEKCQWKNEDRLIFVGDLMSKGNKPLDVLRFVQHSGALCVRGNHDDGALWAHQHFTQSQELEDHYDYTKEFTAEDVVFLKGLPFTIALPELGAIVVHAGLIPGIDLGRQEPKNMYTLRNIRKNETGHFVACEGREGEPWASMWQGPGTLDDLLEF